MARADTAKPVYLTSVKQRTRRKLGQTQSFFLHVKKTQNFTFVINSHENKVYHRAVPVQTLEGTCLCAVFTNAETKSPSASNL